MLKKMEKYQPAQFEKKWTEEWKNKKLNVFDPDSKKKKYYVLVEWPYTSGDLHIGHWFTFTIPDVLSRYKRMNDWNVFFPMGYDAFGLPAENAAIQHKVHPQDWTMKNIKTMTDQFQTMGTMIDWDWMTVTCLPEYYRWNQWIFLKLFEKGLVYRGKTLSNWCPSCQTVLANENVVDGKCWRCDSQVIQKEVDQWFIKITNYADRLIWDEKPKVDWPNSVRVGQNNWIGKKEGINITYKVVDTEARHRVFSSASPPKGGSPKRLTQKQVSSLPDKTIDSITCFTTTPVNFGATFIVVAPEHKFVKKILDKKIEIPTKNLIEVQNYVKKALNKTEEARLKEEKNKTGVFTGLYAINHVTKKEIPIWISDFILANVGTGAVQGCPGHDIRDFEFAKKFNIPIPRVVTGPNGVTGPIEKVEDVVEHGEIMVNSDFLNGIPFEEAMQKTMDYFEKKGWGKRTASYHIRDWSISRQRYWGTPVPTIYCRNCWQVQSSKFKIQNLREGIDYAIIDGKEHIIHPVPDKDLPVELPYEVDFTPHGKPPLATNEKWLNVNCPKCGKPAKRDAETLDTFFDSSWYFLRYVNPKYNNGPFDTRRVAKLTPVDVYFGGAEHTLGHTLYARFFTKFFNDQKMLDYDEFALKRVQHGVVLGPDGNKMSKSKGNVVNPDIQVKEYGSDTVRLYLCFMMPYEGTGPWSDQTIAGVNRFLTRIWEIYQNYFVILRQAQDDKSVMVSSTNHDKNLETKLKKTIKKVTEDISNIKMNTAIAAMMEFLNDWERNPQGLLIESAKNFLQILAPFAPFLTEEIWRSIFGEKTSIHLSSWPKVEGEIFEEKMTIPVQVNGRLRSTIWMSSEKITNKKYVEEMALKEEKVKKYLTGKDYKIVYVPGKILNFVIN